MEMVGCRLARDKKDYDESKALTCDEDGSRYRDVG
jgi:hypothetical protein